MIHKHGHDVTRKVSPVDFSVIPKNCPRFSSPCKSSRSGRNKMKTLPEQGQRAHMSMTSYVC